MDRIKLLEEILPKCWCKETSSESDWTPENPSYGQCAVTALVVQDYFGGKIVNANVQVNGKKESHYFNNIAGEEIDLTRNQFPENVYVPKGAEKKKDFPSTRDYILSYPSTIERYELLKNKVNKIMGRIQTGF